MAHFCSISPFVLITVHTPVELAGDSGDFGDEIGGGFFWKEHSSLI